MTGLCTLLCRIFAARFAFPSRFRPITERPLGGRFPIVAGAAIGLSSGLAGAGGGILTNIIMTFAGMPMHKSIGRAAAAGVVVSLPATIVAAQRVENFGHRQSLPIALARDAVGKQAPKRSQAVIGIVEDFRDLKRACPAGRLHAGLGEAF
jgi:uncharacterized membrane protein YfcA